MEEVKQGNKCFILKTAQHAQKCGGLGLQATGNTGFSLGTTLPPSKAV